jgi:Flp pilus assembly protein CpaB
VASGLAAGLVVRGYEQRLERAAAGPTRAVAVAARDLARGAVLEPAVLRVEPVPERFVPPGAVGDPEEVAGRVLLAPLRAGEPLTRSRLAAAGTGPVAALVDPGLRAFAVPVAVPEGMVRPGDLVDVVATYGAPDPHVETPAAGVEVLAVLGSGPGGGEGLLAPASGGRGGVTHVVVLVTPETAERLAFASAFAELGLSLRGPPG